MNTELPIELECWLLTHGIVESDKARQFGSHGPVVHAEVVKKFNPPWTPKHAEEEPPF
jgi:hypothetical protein